MGELFFPGNEEPCDTCVFHGRHLGFDRNANGANRSANPDNPTTELNMNILDDPFRRYRQTPVATQNFPRRLPAAILDFGR